MRLSLLRGHVCTGFMRLQRRDDSHQAVEDLAAAEVAANLVSIVQISCDINERLSLDNYARSKFKALPPQATSPFYSMYSYKAVVSYIIHLKNLREQFQPTCWRSDQKAPAGFFHPPLCSLIPGSRSTPENNALSLSTTQKSTAKEEILCTTPYPYPPVISPSHS